MFLSWLYQFLGIVERFSNAINLTSLYILLLCLLLTIPLSLVNLCIEFVNTYQVVKEWWKGPPSIYVISLAIGEIMLIHIISSVFTFLVVLASLSAAVSSDFYIVDLTDSQNIHQMINSTSVSANLQGYEGTASLQYSVYIFYVGMLFCRVAEHIACCASLQQKSCCICNLVCMAAA